MKEKVWGGDERRRGKWTGLIVNSAEGLDIAAAHGQTTIYSQNKTSPSPSVPDSSLHGDCAGPE